MALLVWSVGKNEVPRFSRGHGQLGGLVVAHFADEHDVRVQCVIQERIAVGNVMPLFVLDLDL